MLKKDRIVVDPRVRSYHRSVNSGTKRCLDLLGSLVGLMVLGVLLIPIAIAINLDSPGPIFFSQVRYGLGGRRFTLYKFRSMIVGAELLKDRVVNESSGHIFKNAKDLRVTRTGRFLRKTSLDELPQFWNVLRGEMSLVGTRPPTPEEVQHYSNRHWQRLRVKPGMTGEWQVSGRSNIRDFERIVDLDLRYQEAWNVWYDALLILKTLRILVTRSGSC